MAPVDWRDLRDLLDVFLVQRGAALQERALGRRRLASLRRAAATGQKSGHDQQ